LLEYTKGLRLKLKKSTKDDPRLTNNTKSSSKSKEDIKKAEDFKKAISNISNADKNITTADKSEDSYNIMIKKLHLHELERDITNLRSIIAHIIIPKLSLVDLQSVF